MKILHVPFTYYPDAVGGTEVYVKQLTGELVAKGIQCAIAAPGRIDDSYTVEGVAVHRMALPAEIYIDEAADRGELRVGERFAQILACERPDLLHLHAFTRATSTQLLAEAGRCGIPGIFTYHTPTATCMRGTLMRWGERVCDGKMDARACSACMLEGLGLSRTISILLAGAAPGIAGIAGWLPGRLSTAMRIPGRVAANHEAFRVLAGQVERIVAVASWVRDLLLRNGVPAHKIALCRHGVDAGSPGAGRPDFSGALRMLFLGRLTETKGVHILIEAIRRAPELHLMLNVYGVVQDHQGSAYRDRLLQLAGGDPRIHFHHAAAREALPALLRQTHVLTVPSQWMETGPLVVLEAFAAGVPVIASRLGGMRELIDDGVNGWLVDPESPSAWTEALRALCTHPERIRRARQNIAAPRRMTEVAAEMIELYESMLQARTASAAGAYGPEPPHAFRASRS